MYRNPNFLTLVYYVEKLMYLHHANPNLEDEILELHYGDKIIVGIIDSIYDDDDQDDEWDQQEFPDDRGYFYAIAFQDNPDPKKYGLMEITRFNTPDHIYIRNEKRFLF